MISGLIQLPTRLWAYLWVENRKKEGNWIVSQAKPTCRKWYRGLRSIRQVCCQGRIVVSFEPWPSKAKLCYHRCMDSWSSINILHLGLSPHLSRFSNRGVRIPIIVYCSLFMYHSQLYFLHLMQHVYQWHSSVDIDLHPNVACCYSYRGSG